MVDDNALVALLKTLVAAGDDDRWVLRVALLQTAGIDVDAENLASIGGCSVEKADAAIAGLLVSGMVEE